ncbi:MAG TPA: ABC transporter permease [Vicinamibacterales bacterium]|nr:ABC transporter permease [Vicinamibacterales bacterium]
MALRPPRLIRRLLALFRWRSRDRDMDREMAFHVDALTRDYARDGLSDADAQRAARRQFGNVTRLKERGHDVRTLRMAEDLARNVRHAVRGFTRTPGFAITVVLTLALGIGGSTAIFSIVDQTLLRPLPYPNGDELVTIYETAPAFGLGPEQIVFGQTRNVVSPANWLDWQRDSHSLQQLAAWRGASWTLTDAGDPVRLDVQLVSSEFFPLLGVQPLLGRTITPDDDHPNAPRVVVLSHDLWQQRFGGDPKVVGRAIELNDSPARIVGVMPAGFRFLDRGTALWSAFQLDRHEDWRATAGRFMNVVARLRTGTPMSAARAEMAGIADRLAATYPFNKSTSLLMVPLREELTGRVKTSLLMLYATVSVLLAIACLNVANLLVARAASRRRELAIRMSIGAGRAAIVRQLLVESVLLAGAGGVLGAALARESLHALVALAPPELLRVPSLAIDVRVLCYSLGLSLATGVIVGVAPAALAVGESLVASIKASGPSVARAPRARQALVVGQVAMAVVLLCGAGLLVRTLVALNATPTGAGTRDLLTMEVSLPDARYAPERRVEFFRDAVAVLRALPGVEGAAAADSLPVIGDPRGGTAFHRQGTPQRPLMEMPSAIIRVVTPGYFRTLGIPILRGREFSEADDRSSTPGFVVNEAFARKYLSDIDPLSVSLSVWMQPENPHEPVLGVVGDVSEGSLRDAPKPTIFYSERQMTESSLTLFVRARRPETLATAAVGAIHRLDPNLAVTRVRTFEGALAESIAREWLNAMVSGAVAAIGLLLASLGLYGLLSFLVIERTKEIGIRIALGARLARVKGSIVAGGLGLVAIGAAIGVAGSLLLLRSLGALLFSVTPYDVSTYAIVIALLGAIATIASYLPARRAARIQPLVALRQD